MTLHEIKRCSYEIRFITNVHFHKFALDVSTTDERSDVRYPLPRANTYKVHDMLRMANINYGQVHM